MADALSTALAWRTRVATLRRLREGRSRNSHTDEVAGAPAILYPEYAARPVEFAVDILGITPWSRQAEILRSVVEHPKTAVRSGHKIGKSTSAAIIAIWWFSTRPRASVVMTSSSDTQIKEILWPEVQRLVRGAKKPIGGTLYDSHHSGLRADDGRKVIGVSTNRTENMGGYSGAELLFIGDEASGIDEPIFRAIEGNLAGGGHFILFGNPTQMSGTFYEAFHGKVGFWHPIHVASTETPNCTGQGEPIPGLAAPAWVESMRAEHGGPGNAEYDIRVDGNFPGQSDDSIIGAAVVENATKDWRRPLDSDGPLEIGVDVARNGSDKTVIWPRRGSYFYEPTVLTHAEGDVVAAKVLEVVRDLRTTKLRRLGSSTVSGEDVEQREYEKPIVKIDSIGVGASPYDFLKKSKDVVVIAVDAGSAADDAEDYTNLRAQLWFSLRNWLRSGGKFRANELVRQELVGVKYSFDTRNRRRVESKDDIRERIRRSPDFADAMALAVYRAVKKKARAGAAHIGDFAEY